MTTKFHSARAHLLCGSACILLSATQAFAQSETRTPDGGAISLDPIVVRKEDPKGDAADRASSVYVADAELERARSGNLKDLFSGIANVSVGGAIPLTQKIFVNGIDMLNLAISLDGALQNNRAFHHVSANVFDPGLLKFVRVDPGIAAADTGPNAVAGAVVMETVDAADIIRDGESFGGNVRLSYGDNGNTWGRSVTLSTRAQGFEVLLYGRSVTGDDYEDGNGDVVTGTGADLQSGLLKLAYETDTGHRFELSGQQLQDSSLRNFRANFGPGTRPLVRYDTERSSYAFNYEFLQGGAMWNPEVVVGFSESLINAPLFEASEGTTNTLSAKIQNTFRLSGTDTIVAGIDYYDREGSYQSDVSAPIDENTQNIGVFAQARFQPADRWKISTGLRFDRQDFEGVNGFRETYSGASGNFSATYALTESFTLRAGYSNVFGGLQIEDNYIYTITLIPGREWDYASLEPSRSQNWNLGFDWENGGLTLGGEAVLTEIEDVRNGGDTFDFKSEGFNLYATYGWTNGFARLTFSDSETSRDGDEVSSFYQLDFGAPLGQVLALEVQQQLPRWNMLVGGSIDMALDYDPNPNSSLEVDPLRTLEGYTVLNLFAEYTPPRFRGVTLRGEVRNVFDEAYAARATYGGDYAGFATLNEPGRTLVVEAVARF